MEAVLVQAADAISAARPGARRESLENYIKRLEKLEEIANSFQGVEKCFAIQSGREVRIMVKPEDITDDGTLVLAKEVAKRIEKEMEYPGQIQRQRHPRDPQHRICQIAGAVIRNLNHRLWHCRAKASFRLTAAGR